MMDALTLINQANHIRPEIKRFLRSIRKDIEAIDSRAKVSRIRVHLNTLGNRGRSTQTYTSAVIWLIKQVHKDKLVGVEDHTEHTVTDHALVKYMERELGYDIKAFKDTILADTDLVCCYPVYGDKGKNGSEKIITFLPKEE